MEDFKKTQIGHLEIKLIENEQEFQEALNLTYDAYVDEKKYINKNKLPLKQIKTKKLWDDYDFTQNTKQIIIKNIFDNETIGRFRLIDGNTPIEQHFSLQKYLSMPIREVSRLTIKPEHRKTKLPLIGAFNVIYNISKNLGQLFCTSFSERGGLYELIGAEKIGEFTNPSFQDNSRSLVYRWDLSNLKTRANDSDIKKEYLKYILQPIQQKNKVMIPTAA